VNWYRKSAGRESKADTPYFNPAKTAAFGDRELRRGWSQLLKWACAVGGDELGRDKQVLSKETMEKLLTCLVTF
jgi:hypothetical protein